MPRHYDIGQLNKLYQSGESIDREVFAEMRSNILLVAGDHFSKRGSRAFNQIRDNRDLTDYQKLRIFKNHIHKIQRRYANAILEYANGVTISPQLEHERQDQKASELNKKVWKDAEYRHDMDELFMNFADDFTTIGECCLMIRWDPEKGDLVGYEAEVDADGIPIQDDVGTHIPNMARPVFSGDFEFRRLFAFKVMRAAANQHL
jgi:hypothetical protein